MTQLKFESGIQAKPIINQAYPLCRLTTIHVLCYLAPTLGLNGFTGYLLPIWRLSQNRNL